MGLRKLLAIFLVFDFWSAAVVLYLMPELITQFVDEVLLGSELNADCLRCFFLSKFKVLLVTFTTLGLLLVAIVFYLCPELRKDRKPPKLEDEWWGKGPLLTDVTEFPKDNTDIKKYAVEVKDSVLEDLKRRLDDTRFVDPLDNVQFQYGFHSAYLKEIVEYWKTKYDWRKQEQELNKFNHYVTQIEGIDVHYIHHKPDLQDKKLSVLPLLLVHGWPGSVYEFCKILPLLTTPREGRDYVFEVICPSIPGYGFSEAPHQPGFSMYSAARMFSKLMARLGHQTFYAQGGDWGSIITSTIAIAYPERILGLHLNMPRAKTGIFFFVKYAIGSLFPSLFMTPEEYAKTYPFKNVAYFLLEETGYGHIQATKPDTVGSALADSPTGLAAYILEKFSTWTDRSYRELPDGGLTKKYTLDELLTNVMIYWCTNTIASSQRFYKEAYNKKSRTYDFVSLPIKVPTGVAVFPHEILVLPKFLLQHAYRNLVSFTEMPRGGHFAAFEEPELLADEIWDFVIRVREGKKLK